MGSVPRICVFGTFDPKATRNRILLGLLKATGYEVEFCHVPLWKGQERFRLFQKSKLRILLRHLLRTPLLLIRFFRLRRPDLLLVAYPGHLDMLLARGLGRFTGARILFDPFLSLFDTIVSDRGLKRPDSWIGRLALWLDRFSLRLAHRVLVDTPEDADFLSRLSRLPSDRFRVLWVGAEEKLFHPQKGIPPEKNLVFFYGTFIPVHGISTIVRAAKLLQADGVRFRILGQGQESPQIGALAADLAVSNVEFLPMLRYEELPQEIARASLCLGIFGTSEKAQRVVPHKVYEAMAVGRPVLTADTPAVRNAFQPGVEIALSAAGDPVALAQAIRDLLKDPARLEAIGQAGRQRFLRDYSEAALSLLLRQHISEIVGNSASRGLPHKEPSPWVPTPRYLLRRYAILHWVDRLPRGGVIEVGCGAGDLLLQLARRGFRGVGVEPSAQARSEAQRRIRPVADRFSVVSEIEQAQGPFDLLIASEVLEHIEQDQAALKSWACYLAKGGRILITVPAHPRWWGPSDEWAGHFRRYERKVLIARVEKAGFSLERFWCIGFPLGNLAELFGHRIHARHLEEGLSRAERTARSGLERGWQARLLACLVPEAVWLPFCWLQLPFAGTNLGISFLLMARKG